MTRKHSAEWYEKEKCRLIANRPNLGSAPKRYGKVKNYARMCLHNIPLIECNVCRPIVLEGIERVRSGG